MEDLHFFCFLFVYFYPSAFSISAVIFGLVYPFIPYPLDLSTLGLSTLLYLHIPKLLAIFHLLLFTFVLGVPWGEMFSEERSSLIISMDSFYFLYLSLQFISSLLTTYPRLVLSLVIF